MKKLIIMGLISFISSLHANINTIVSILPQKTFVKAIGGNKIDVTVMVKPGNSPHTYEPKPSQMKDISKAELYLAIGVEFEHNWLPKFKNQNSDMKIIDISKNIERLNKDPHVWVTPQNVKTLLNNILTILIEKDPVNKDYYQNNYNKFVNKINQTDIEIRNILKDLPKDSKFMVFHPSWGSFAKQYSLVQIPIEVDGKAPKPREIIKLIKEAKIHNIRAVFTAPEFSKKVAQQIASQLNIKVVPISPLNPKWSKNLIKLAKAIANH